MPIIIGPVVVTREGGFGFDLWTSADGLCRGFSYGRVEDACYARKVEIRARTKVPAGPIMACTTLDEFVSALAGQPAPVVAAQAGG